MGTNLMKAVWESGCDDGSMLLLLLALAHKADDTTGECSMNFATLTQESRQSERNCRYILRRLEMLGIVERFEGRGRSHQNRYSLHLENLQKGQPLPVLEEGKPAKGATIAGFREEKGQPLPVLPVLEPTENLQKGQPLPVLSPPNGMPPSPCSPSPVLSPPEEVSPPLSPHGGTPATQRKGVGQPRARPQRFVPDDFTVTPDMQSWALTNVPGVNVEMETSKMRDHEYKSPHTDWVKAWRNWMRGAWERLPVSEQRQPSQRPRPFKVAL